MPQDLQIYYVTAFAVTTLVVGVGAWLTSIKKKSSPSKSEKLEKQRPEKWCLVGKIAKLIIYPIKSCQGVIVQEAVITTLGLKCTFCSIWLLINKFNVLTSIELLAYSPQSQY